MFHFCLPVRIVKGWDETKTSPYWRSWQFGIVGTALLTAGQWAFIKPPRGISEEQSNAPFFVLQQSPMLCSLLRENWPALVQSFALRATAEAPGAARDVWTLHQSVSTPWDHLPSTGQDLQVTLFRRSLSSAEPKSRSNTREKQGRSTVNEIPLNCNEITWALLCRFQEEKDAMFLQK